MKRIKLNISVFVLILTLVTVPSQGFVSGFAGPISGSELVMLQAFSEAEMDELLAPIALYPDPLLAQLLPAATFVDQIGEAQKTLNGKSDDNLIANQKWDVSVKSIAHYPSVLQMMNQKIDWTTALGQAYVTQAADVEKAIQRLRAQAKDAGTLVSNDKTLVETKTEGGQQVIVIEPAQAEVIYVPQYDPQVVYVQQGPSTGSVVAAEHDFVWSWDGDGFLAQSRLELVWRRRLLPRLGRRGLDRPQCQYSQYQRQSERLCQQFLSEHQRRPQRYQPQCKHLSHRPAT